MAGPGALTPLHECATSDALRCAELLAPLARDTATVASRQLEEALTAPWRWTNRWGGGWKNHFFLPEKVGELECQDTGLGNSNQLYMVNWDVC